MRTPAAILVLGALAAACTAVRLPDVDAALLRNGAARGHVAATLQRGRSLLLRDCIACHGTVHPRDLSMSAWRDVLPRMIDYARLHAADREAIEAYVAAAGTAPE